MKTVVVTGATGGIGRAIAFELARTGHRVIVLARNPRLGRLTIEEIRTVTGGVAEMVVGDLKSMATVRDAAAALMDSCERIDVLVQNAGIWPTRLMLNEDKLEKSFMVNHLAPFMLNLLLEDLLIGSKARVVQVSAAIYVLGRVDLERTPTGGDFSIIRTYPTTKLCNLLCSRLFSRRWWDHGVTINYVHPGVIRTRLGEDGGLLSKIFRLTKVILDPPEIGAQGPVHLATAPELDGISGRYYNQLKQRGLGPKALDDTTAEALWRQAGELTGLTRQIEIAPA